jgi:hypothetical protein
MVAPTGIQGAKPVSPLRQDARRLKPLALAAVIAGVLACAAPASADVVTNTNDSGAGSLRDAVASTAAGGTVTFASGVTGTITLTTGAIQIDKNLTITGPGARSLTVSGNNASRVFEISGVGITVTLQALTIANGQTPNGGSENGGGVSAGNGVASLVVEDSTIRDNTAGPSGFSSGGGISMDGSLTVRRSTFTGNRAIGESSGSAEGGALDTSACSPALVTVENSTIAGNSATSDTSAEGGGIDAFGSLVIRNSTIVSNTVTGPSFSRGGGVFSSVDCDATRGVEASIIAGNTIVGGAPGASNDCDFLGDTIDGNDNVIGDPSECSLNGVNNVNGTGAPGLDPLANNGGPTDTVSLTEASPAMDHVRTSACPPPATDQRGLPRPGGSACDSGAWEGQFGIAIAPPSHDFGSVQVGGSSRASIRATSPPFRFTVSNTADRTANLTTVSTTNPQFAVVPGGAGSCPIALAKTATCSVDVTFTPTATGQQSGTLNVASSNAGNVSASLLGTGFQPQNPPPPPPNPCASDSKGPKVTISSDQKRTVYGVGQNASITTKASDASGLKSDPSRKGQKVSTSKTGTFSVRKSATDNCDNTGAATFRYRVVAAPRATIVHTPSPPGCRTRIVALGVVTSTMPLRGSQIFVDGKLVVSGKSKRLTAKILTRRLSNGTHRMVVTAVDSLGRRVQASRTFVIRCS